MLADNPGMQAPTDSPFYLVAVHGGAGAHPPSADAATKDALRRAARAALLSLATNPMDALSALTHAVTTLEDAEPLNAGFGSNLTLAGRVECDASLMDGRSGAFGGVGAVSGVRHPIAAARAVLEGRRTKDAVLGRVPPLLLVGDGAALLAGVRRVDPESMVSPRARREWQVWKARMVQGGAQGPRGDVEGLHARQDTVGAVVWDSSGGLAAGVSRYVRTPPRD